MHLSVYVLHVYIYIQIGFNNNHVIYELEKRTFGFYFYSWHNSLSLGHVTLYFFFYQGNKYETKINKIKIIMVPNTGCQVSISLNTFFQLHPMAKVRVTFVIEMFFIAFYTLYEYAYTSLFVERHWTLNIIQLHVQAACLRNSRGNKMFVFVKCTSMPLCMFMGRDLYRNWRLTFYNNVSDLRSQVAK